MVLMSTDFAHGYAAPIVSPPPQTRDQESKTQSLLADLGKAQQLIKDGKIPDALELLEAATKAAAEIELKNLALREDILWQAAMAHLEFAQQLTNADQRKHFASSASDLWLTYIHWFHTLSDAEKSKLPPSNSRINAATRHLGNAIVLAGDLPRLFDEYMRIPRAEYLGTDAIDLWKSSLYRCPDWGPADQRTAAHRRAKICNEECKDHWLAYAATLREWAEKYNLRKAAKDSYIREAEQIQKDAERCSE